jgi:hypothetical protein
MKTIKNYLNYNRNLSQTALLITGIILGSLLSKVFEINLIVITTTGTIIFLLLLVIYYKGFQIESGLQILEINRDRNLRSLNISMVNNNLLEDEYLFRAIFKTIYNNEEFLNFGYYKIIILSVVLVSDKEHSLHSNILINNETTFEEYYSFIKNELDRYNNLAHGYHNELISRFIVKAWNVDNDRNKEIKQTYKVKEPISRVSNINSIFKGQTRSYSTYRNIPKEIFSKKWYKGLINPLSLYRNTVKGPVLKLKHPKSIFTMDLETIAYNNVELVVAISSCGYYKGLIDNQIFLIDYNLLKSDSKLAVQNMWNNYFKYLEEVFINEESIDKKLTIFAHNLGEFDGYFLYKALLNHYNVKNVTSLVDDTNSFISITLTDIINIEWKDSLRIFPLSLDKLCKMFSVEGKTNIYNLQFRCLDLLFNNVKLLNEFIEYSKQDALSLYNALTHAQNLYFNKFKIDIESIYSTATLSLKIYRTNFQPKPIFILPSNIDSFIRNGYYGGGTDVYKGYATKVYKYDVNSLYPHAMLKPMPYNLISNGIINISYRSLDTFFGFVLAKIECPVDMLRPVLPYHKDGKTIYPVGNWEGVYFSEELKAVEKLGYKITLIKGLEFSKEYLFQDFVEHFYKIKQHSTGVERETAKLQLNNLYGYFGRKQIGINTENVHNNELKNILLTRIVKSINPINDNYSTVLTYSNINYKLLKDLNNQFHSIGSDKSFIMSNVGLAAAVTAYARMHMIPFKIHPDTLYTDTDSAFTTSQMDPSLIGKELGLMKDELKGLLIEEAYFVGPKKYGYWLLDRDGTRIEESVFSGVPRNSLSFNEVKSIFEGQTIIKNVSNKFYKSFTNLNITIKDINITIKNTNIKLLQNNLYYPIVVNNGYQSYLSKLFDKFKNLYIKINKNF